MFCITCMVDDHYVFKMQKMVQKQHIFELMCYTAGDASSYNRICKKISPQLLVKQGMLILIPHCFKPRKSEAIIRGSSQLTVERSVRTVNWEKTIVSHQ